MKDEIIFLRITSGILAALLLLIVLVPSSYNNQARIAKQECEKTLPRNQECKVIAIPEVKENK